MTIGSAFRDIADVLDEFEEAGFDVVEPRSRDREGSVAVEFGAALPALEGIEAGEAVDVSVRGASVDEDGRVVLDVSVDTAVGAAPRDAEAAERDAPDEGDGSALRGDDSTGTSPGGDRGRTDEGDAGEAAEESGTPVHRDPEKLRAAYEAHDTFPEMTDALGVDVTAQTVRRQMIEHGIHEPAGGAGSDDGEPAEGADETGGDRGAGDDGDATGDDDESEEADGNAGHEGIEEGRDGEAVTESTATLADGIDLPDGTGLDDVKAAVRSARTVHEVGRALGIERDRTRRLLDELDLLELVTGRISAEREVPPEEIDRRVERAAPGSA